MDDAKTIARQVHMLLLAARPEANDANLVKAAHLAEAAGEPGNHLQLETFVAIRNIETAIENGASAAELESLLMHAIDMALRWITA
jgi:hypothetical protein